uniref:Uncharacterized protein n=1 Tax=Meloidogyne enterolobii TaxID=390850 RepID=A0A6V7UM38_MELEN|nr:unnamed protein product [Meloidogyne enterolobii]
MEELKNFKPIDLYEKLRLSDNDFDAWLEKLGLLHGKRTCYKCGGRTTISVKKVERYGCWRCTTRNWQQHWNQAGNNTGTYKSYLPEFLWRKRFGNIENVFYNFWHHVSLFYPCERNE